MHQVVQQLSSKAKAKRQALGIHTCNPLGLPDKRSSTVAKFPSAVAEDERGCHGI